MSEPVLRIAIPSTDGRVHIQTAITLHAVRALLGRPVQWMLPETSGISKCRNLVLDGARGLNPDLTHGWMLWLDSDMVVPGEFARTLADDIVEAEQRGLSWCANYPMANGQSVLMRPDGEHYTAAELLALPMWAPLGWGALGLAYVDMPFGYRFHEDSRGEDAYLHDEASIQFHFARNLKAVHHKAQHLVGPATWEPADA